MLSYYTLSGLAMIAKASGSRSYLSVSSVIAVAWRFVFFCILWFIFSEGDFRSWPFGVPTVLVATWFSSSLTTGPEVCRLKVLRLVPYIPFFLIKSLGSGVDVMKRVFHPGLPIDPALIEYPLTISHEKGRILLANSITLLPGTISAQLCDDHIVVHTLDKGLPVQETIRDLEGRIASLYDSFSDSDSEVRKS